jgi:hypothetical protein
MSHFRDTIDHAALITFCNGIHGLVVFVPSMFSLQLSPGIPILFQNNSKVVELAAVIKNRHKLIIYPC